MPMTSNMADPAALDNWNAFQRAKNTGHDEYVTLATKCNDFYMGGGKQWEDADRRRLEEDGRPALEINMVLTTINALLGEHASQRGDIVYRPRKRADTETAEALTALASHIQDDNRFEYVEGQVFSDGIIQDRGYFDIRMDFDRDIQGEVQISSLNPLTVMLDPSANEYDPATWNEVTVSRWLSLDDIEIQYGADKRRLVEAYVNSGETFGSESVQFEQQNFGDSQSWFEDYLTDNSKGIRRVRVIERQHRKLFPCDFFVDNETGDMSQIPIHTSDERIAAMIKMANVSVIRKVVKKIRWTVSVDGALMFDDWSPYRRFTIVPFFPYFRRGKPFGVVRNLLSAQEQLNKIESQELHVINTTANSGWIIEAGSLVNMTPEELEQRGAQTGLIMVTAAGKEAPIKITPNQVPTGLDRASAKAMAAIKQISGVHEAMLGAAQPEVSGVAIQAQQQRGLVQLQVPFDNLNLTRRLVAERMLELIQDFYDETRFFKVIDYKDPEHPQKEFGINVPQAAGNILNDITVGEYEVVISNAPARDTLQESQFAEAIELRNAGVGIPDDVVIENSHLSNKAQIAERVRKLQGMGEPSPEEVAMANFERDIGMKRMVLELEELQAKARALSAQAQLSEVKAGIEKPRFEMDTKIKFKEMQDSIASMIAELQTKLEIASMHSQTGLSETIHTNTTKRVIEELKARATLSLPGGKK